MRAAFIALCLAAAVLAVVPSRADQIADAVGAMSADVEDVRVVGNWSAEGKAGVYRVVVTRSGTKEITARLFVQWIAYAGNGASGQLIASREIGEFAALGVNLIDYTFETSDTELAIYLQTVKPDGTDEKGYELVVESPDRWRFGPQGN